MYREEKACVRESEIASKKTEYSSAGAFDETDAYRCAEQLALGFVARLTEHPRPRVAQVVFVHRKQADCPDQNDFHIVKRSESPEPQHKEPREVTNE